MAEKISVNVYDLVLLTGAVITQVHNFLARWKWFWVFEDAICHYFHALIRNIKYAINLIRDSAVCFVPI